MAGGLLLVLDRGASTLKFTVFREAAVANSELVARGQIGMGVASRLTARGAKGEKLADEPLECDVKDARGVLLALARWMRLQFGAARVVGIGHRVVHGGTRHSKPALVTPVLLSELRQLQPLAPVRQAQCLELLEAALECFKEVPQVACFDTSFHRGMPEVAELVPLPADLRMRGVQRYGFHGLSYEYIASILPNLAPQVAEGRVVVAHLGGGAGMCALKGRRSQDCSQGFSMLDGLCMDTRPGSIDAGVLMFLVQGLGKSVADVEEILCRKPGLLGISGISGDLRELLASSALEARLAVDYFVYRAAREIGAMAASLGGIDAVLFTGSIGAKSSELRRRICVASAWLGIDLDEAANTAGGPCISRRSSRVSAWCIPTQPDLLIARHTRALVGLSS